MFRAGKLTRYYRSVDAGAEPDWENGAEVVRSGLLARNYALAAIRYRPAEYRVTPGDVKRAQNLGWKWAIGK
jgi:hypothetical protein